MISRRVFASGIAAAALPLRAWAEDPKRPLRIGVLSDMSGPYSGFGGPGSVVGARLAVADVGGTVLDRPVEVVSADHQNKAAIGGAAVRQWFDVDGVGAVFDVLNSGIAQLVQTLAREKNKVAVFSGLNNKDLTGKACSPNGMVWGYDSYALAQVAAELVRSGLKSWFFITVDYASGYTLEQDTSAVIKRGGGSVAGAVRYPLGSTDYGAFLLQAQSSGAQVVALATGGADMQNVVKQSTEFGLKQRIVPLFTTTLDVRALGLERAKGIPLITDFYWDQDDRTRAWAARFQAAHGSQPTDVQATVYSAVLHYLKSVQAAGTDDTTAVLAAMKARPVDDMMTSNATIRADGRLMRDMYFAEVKSPAESARADDTLKILARIPAATAFRPEAESECPALKAP
jgi:branched-chain amino acid transport system substrate-binding protein